MGTLGAYVNFSVTLSKVSQAGIETAEPFFVTVCVYVKGYKQSWVWARFNDRVWMLP